MVKFNPMKSTILLTTLLCSGLLTYAQKQFAISKEFKIRSGGGWDYLITNPNSNTLYVSHATQVNVLDKNTGDSLGVIENTTGVHGIAIIQALGKGYTSNGIINNVFVFDLKTNKVLNQINTGEKPDAIFYEPISNTIITCNAKSKDLSIIDPISEKVIATIPVGGKPETAVADEKGNVFVNIEDKNEIVQVDIKEKAVVKHINIQPAEEPTGLAIDTDLHLLFAGADEKVAIVNYKSGKVVKTIKIGEGCDGVAYDQASKTLFTSNGSGTLSIIKANSKNEFELIQTLKTPKGARTICLDLNTKKVYTLTSLFEELPAGTTGRPKSIPGTMKVLVIE
jgi:YVTN family beta-propeller protein